MIFQLNLQL